MAFNLFDTPDYYTGLLGEEATQKLQNKALGTGLVNAALAFIAQPRNQRYGSALPYLGKALMGGYQAGQDVIQGGLRDYETQQKIEELKRQKTQREAFDIASKNLYRNIPAQMQAVTTPGGYAPAQTEVQEGQVSPNFSMTRLPDLTSQIQTAPARQELNQEALQQMMLSGDPRAAGYLSGLKTLKELTTPAKADLVKAGAEEALYDPNTGTWIQSPVAKAPKPIDVGADLNAQSLADYNKPFTELQPQERQSVIGKVNAEKTSRAAAGAIKLPPQAKAILETDTKTIEGLTANANSARSIAAQTRNINSLIGNRQGSGLVKLSADTQNFLGVKSPEANVNQAVQALATKAATEIRTPGSGSTSDLEFGAYRSSFPSLATSNEGRQLMAKIAEANAVRMSKLADWARTAIKNDTFSYEGLAAYDNSLGKAVSADIEKRVKILSGGKNAQGGWSVEEAK